MMYQKVATGGTFDHIHAGHRRLLEKSFQVGDHVIIGLTSDEFVAKVGKKPAHDYAFRERQLRGYLDSSFPGREYTIAKLFDYFGPGIAEADVQALVASPETSSRLSIANDLRRQKGFPPLVLVTVDWVPAEDGKPISSTRIRGGEIDQEGRLQKDGERSNPTK
jgi:cytidyltransferase-like protein